MIKLDKDKKVWITSDTHYSHKNICRGVTNWRMPDGSVPVEQTRDFPTIETMNASIVNNINGLVGQDDILIHLGDWSYPISSWNSLRKGRIHLHGHCHLPNHAKISNGRRMDIGMDGNPDFAPYDLLEVINMLKKREIGSELGPLDHHMDDMQNVVG